MEIIAPIALTYSYIKAPLSPGTPRPTLSAIAPQNMLALAFLIHYTNRALISPLRTPSRSKSHLAVPLAAIAWNLTNGWLIGSYLSSPVAFAYLSSAFSQPRFWLGMTLWAAGLAGNIIHDEILLNLRRNKSDKPKGSANDTKGDKPRYSIPRGLLFEYVTFPNYFCEWVEWAGFALAASPLPSLASKDALFASLTPPWLFFIAEFLVMFPRAWKGHQWYHEKFSDYPKDRRVAIPYIL
jgi:3-oxo-5-alpha-steroid 4-dehydrogenase 1